MTRDSRESGLLTKVKDVVLFRASLSPLNLAQCQFGLWGTRASVRATLLVGMLSGTFYGRDVAAVPHPRAAQLAQVV